MDSFATTEYVPYYHFTEKNVYDPPVDAAYTQVQSDLDAKSMGRVIGKDGCVFNAICHQTGADYIWYQRNTGIIEIWGPEDVLTDARNRIQAHLERVRNQMYPAL
jgi:hypothetical protein